MIIGHVINKLSHIKIEKENKTKSIIFVQNFSIRMKHSLVKSNLYNEITIKNVPSDH